MNIDEYLEKIENVEREYIPAFSALKPKRKISLLETDIKDFLRARKRANYYQSVKEESWNDASREMPSANENKSECGF